MSVRKAFPLDHTLKRPGGILEKIVLNKLDEVRLDREKRSLASLTKIKNFDAPCYVLRDFILDPARTGIIAEFKRASPSKGLINGTAQPSIISSAYAEAGASAISVLTDKVFFGGSTEDLEAVRAVNKIPVLRKEFIVDEYQILEAKALGADIILLIAAVLQPEAIYRFSALAQSLGMSVLLEVHNLKELEESICDTIDAVGVNNRNLKDFSVSLEHSHSLVSHIPDQFIKVSESGISDVNTIADLKKIGFQGFLIGENFMREENPELAILDFVNRLRVIL